MAYILRDYQKEAVKAGLKSLETVKKHGFLVLPTAAGKGLVISELAKQAGGNVLVLQPTAEILRQNYDNYTSFDLEAGIFSASMDEKTVKEVTFGTPGSIVNRREILGQFDYIIIDECHRVAKAKKGKDATTYEKIIKECNVPTLGLTASPLRNHTSGDWRPGAGKPFPRTLTIPKMLNRTQDKIFSTMSHITQVEEMVDKGYWVKPTYEVNTDFPRSDMKQNSTGGEFETNSMQAVLNKYGIGQATIMACRDLEERGYKHILVFVDSVKRAVSVATKLGQKDAMWVSGEVNKKERFAIVDKFKAGEYTFLVNVGVFREGADFPMIDALVIARPTMSFALHLQMIGRGVRPYPGKGHVLVSDLVRNSEQFGKIEETRIFKHDVLGEIVATGNRLISGVPAGEEHSWMLGNNHLVRVGQYATRMIRGLNTQEYLSITKSHPYHNHIESYWLGHHNDKHTKKLGAREGWSRLKTS